MAKTEIQKTSTATSVSQATVVPDFLKEHLGNRQGFENTNKEDFVLPRLSIAQSLTPERKKTNARYIESLKEGDFFDNVSGKVYGPTVQVVAVFFTRNRIKFLKPIGSGIDCQSINGKNGGRLHPAGCRSCQFSQWGETGPECTEFKNLVVLVRDPEAPGGIAGPMVFSNKSTAISVLKQWNSQMNLMNMPMFAGIWELNTLTTTRNNNEYFTYNFKRVGYVPQPIFESAKAFFDALSDKDIAFNIDDLDVESETNQTNDGAQSEM